MIAPLTQALPYPKKGSWGFPILYGLIALTCLAHLLHDASSTLLGVSLPALKARWHFSESMIGAIMAVFSASASMLQPLWGWLADTAWLDAQTLSRHGTGQYTLSGWLAGGLTLIALLLTAGFLPWIGAITPNTQGGFTLLLSSIALGALGVGIFHPVGTSLMHSLSPSHLRHGLMNTFLCSGTLGGALGAWVYPTLGLQGLPQWLWVCLLILPLYLWYAWHIIPYAQRNTSGASADTITSNPLPLNPQAAASSVLTFSKTQKLWLLVALWSNNLCRTTMILVIATFLPSVWRESHHLSDTTIAHAMMMNGLLATITGITLGRCLDQHPHHETPLLTLCFCMTLFCAIPLCHSQGIGHIGLYWLLGGVLSASVGVNVVMGLRTLQGHSNVVSGVIGGWAFGLSGLLMYPVGWWMEHEGVMPVMQTLLIGSSVLGLLSLGWFPWLLKRYQHTPSNPPVRN
ncbi:MAG: MFS transporter [Vampirovibrionales bacterium]